MTSALYSGVRWLRETIAEVSAVDLALALTLIDLLLQPVGNWAIRPLILALASAALVFGEIRRSAVLWWVLFALAGARLVLDYPMPDNHAYLLAWWFLACALCLPSRERARALATSARLLIGLAFLLAVIWKAVLSQDFLDQTFFRITLLLDSRFAALTELVGGVPSSEIESLRERLRSHIDGPFHAAAPVSPLSPRFLALAGFATTWTLAIELIVALAFLWPTPRGLAKLRDAALLTFCATTYAIAPVEDFGWLLLAMGAAQCDRDHERTRWAYLAVFLLILLYREMPWAELLRTLLAVRGRGG